MTSPFYSGYRFPSDIIQRAIWLYLRFTLSYRDVEERLAERGVEVSYETIRRWVLSFGSVIARQLRARRPKPHSRWHLDGMFVRMGGKQMYLWRAVDAEGEVLGELVQAKRIGLTAHAPARRRQGTGIGPMGAQRLEDGLDPLIARRHLVLIGVVQRQRLFEREQMLGAIMTRQSLPDRLGAGVTPDVP